MLRQTSKVSLLEAKAARLFRSRGRRCDLRIDHCSIRLVFRTSVSRLIVDRQQAVRGVIAPRRCNASVTYTMFARASEDCRGNDGRYDHTTNTLCDDANMAEVSGAPELLPP